MSIHDRIRRGVSTTKLSRMLKRNPIDEQDHKGQSALHVAATEGRVESVRVLLKKGSGLVGVCFVFLFLCLCVYIVVCMRVCVIVCVCKWVLSCVYASAYRRVCFVCRCVCVCVCVCVCMLSGVYVCVFVPPGVCSQVCSFHIFWSNPSTVSLT
jgi:ankyrin repeat protein